MTSTPEELRKKQQLKMLVKEVGELAWENNPEVAACAICKRENEIIEDLNEITYDEFYVIEHNIQAIPAKRTNGIAYLRYRRRISADRKRYSLWYFWEPGYAGTKPEAVEEMLPIIQSHHDKLSEGLSR